MTQKEHIVEQAMRMFVAQGIKAVRMDDIAQQLGVSKRTLYELFGDKEGLLHLAMTCYFDRNRSHWAEVTREARNVLERMFLVLDDMLEHAETTSRMMENLRKFYPEVYNELVRESYEKNRQEFRRMLEEGIAQGFFIDDINIDLAIAVFYHTAEAITARRGLILPEGLSQRSAFRQIVSTFFRGVSTARGGEIIDRCIRRWHSDNDQEKRIIE